MFRVKKYSLQGWKLTQKSWQLLVLYILVELHSFIGLLFSDFSTRWIYTLLNLGLTIFSVGFFLSLPAFLLRRKKGEPLSAGIVWHTLFENTKRSAGYTILIGLLVLIIFMLLSVSFFSKSPMPIPASEMEKYMTSFRLIWLPLTIGITFFCFSSIYFSIEKISYPKSLAKGFVYAINNLEIVLFNCFIAGLLSLIFLYMPVTNPLLQQLIALVGNSAVLFILNAINLNYYLENKD